jgi:hypothetical protein
VPVGQQGPWGLLVLGHRFQGAELSRCCSYGITKTVGLCLLVPVRHTVCLWKVADFQVLTQVAVGVTGEQSLWACAFWHLQSRGGSGACFSWSVDFLGALICGMVVCGAGGSVKLKVSL